MMRAMRTLLAVASIASFSLFGCNKKDNPKPEGDTKPVTTGKADKPVETVTVGMLDPFGRLAGDAGKSLDKAWKAAKAKKWDDAQAAFKEVIAASPDYTPARWALVRAQILGGKTADVPEAFEGLISRDYVGYVGKLDKGKELMAIRSAPEWAKIEALKAKYKAAYTDGLDKGIFIVARSRSAADVKPDAPVDLKQEAYHYDPETKRFRRLTDTNGQVFALDLTHGRKSLTFLVATKITRGKADAFVDPKVGVIDLSSLDMVGPATMKGTWESVTLGETGDGMAAFVGVPAGGAESKMTFDTAKTGLAKLDAELSAGGETKASPGQVVHLSTKALTGVKMTDGANQFTLEGGGSPIVSARPLAASSIEWNPAKNKLTYAGKLDACKALADAKSTEKNELFVYDTEKKSAQRVASGVSAFESFWLDDDRLVYESGVGKKGELHIYTFSTHADAALPTKHGAGLYGVPTLACEKADEAEAQVDDVPSGADEGD
jgi:hypothetical protein